MYDCNRASDARSDSPGHRHGQDTFLPRTGLANLALAPRPTVSCRCRIPHAPASLMSVDRESAPPPPFQKRAVCMTWHRSAWGCNCMADGIVSRETYFGVPLSLPSKPSAASTAAPLDAGVPASRHDGPRWLLPALSRLGLAAGRMLRCTSSAASQGGPSDR